MLAVSFAYALEDIPTRHLETCFMRAIRAKTDTFPLVASAVNRQWVELQAEGLTSPSYDAPQLPAPNSGYMTLNEFKAKHNLPADWKLGDP